MPDKSHWYDQSKEKFKNDYNNGGKSTPGDPPAPASAYRERALFQHLKEDVPAGHHRDALERIDRLEKQVVELLERRAATPAPTLSPQGDVPAARLNRPLGIVPVEQIAKVRQELNNLREDTLRAAGFGPAIDESRAPRDQAADLDKDQGKDNEGR